MSNTHILFEDPSRYPIDLPYTIEGGSPKFLRFLINFLTTGREKISSIRIALYLFNNIRLHRLFTDLANHGITIDVYSIPPDGYDDGSPQLISGGDGEAWLNEKHTKYSLAQLIYQEFTNKPDGNYKLFCFPHTYIRSPRVKPFSRGMLPFSLHTKFMMIKMKNGKTMVAITSSNLALRDQIKHDFFVLKEISGPDAAEAEAFFYHLKEASVLYSASFKKIDYFTFPVKVKIPTAGESLFSLAPFYSGSPENTEKIINQMVNCAVKRIWIMAQHISAFQYPVPAINNQSGPAKIRNGILHHVIDRGLKGVEIRCISQTYSGPGDEKFRFRKPVNSKNFVDFTAKLRDIPSAKYLVNENVHSKYILIDDTVIATTFNYTPTQFIYIPEVKIDSFQNMQGMRYKGIFSEVGQMIILGKKDEVSCFEKNFEYVMNDPASVKVLPV